MLTFNNEGNEMVESAICSAIELEKYNCFAIQGDSGGVTATYRAHL
jgi:hypothetical protein